MLLGASTVPFRCVGCWLIALLTACLWMTPSGRPSAMAGSEGLTKAELQESLQASENLFHQANELYPKDRTRAAELYREAALHLERIIEQGGVRNGRLYYNLGNIYLRLEQVGHAILSYRKAEKYIPTDENLRQNLNYALRFRRDDIQGTEQSRVLHWLLDRHYGLSRVARLWLFVCCFNLFWMINSVALFKRDSRLKKAAALSALLSVVFGGSLLAEAYRDGSHRQGVILQPEVIARQGDGEVYQPAFKGPLHAGAEFSLLEKRAGWYHIKLLDGSRCWVPTAAAGLIDP